MSVSQSQRLRKMVVALILSVCLSATRVAAQSDGTAIIELPADPPAFAIAPIGEPEGAYFAVTMEPGAQQTLSAALVNAGEGPFEARTFVADVFTSVNGGMGVRDHGTEPTGPTTWIDYPDERLTLDPLGTAERAFTVSVPEDTVPGQYIAAIVLQTAEPIPIAGSTMFTQVLRKSAAVFVTVPGPIAPGLAVGDVALVSGGAGSVLTVEVANTGNVLVRPAGEVVLRDSSGDAVLTAPVAMGPVYAGDATTIEIPIAGPLPPGDHTVDVALSEESHGLASSMQALVTVEPPTVPDPAPPFVLGNVALVAMPSPEAIQYLEIGVRIANSGAPVGNARVVLHVQRDGTAVEDFPLASSLALPTGETDVAQRFVPSGGWVSGAYTFGLTLETVDAASGVAVVVADSAIDGVVVVP